MGTSYSGSFKEFRGFKATVPPAAPVENSLYSFPLGVDSAGSNGDYTIAETGTPTYGTALNSHNPNKRVVQLDRGSDLLTISGDNAFMTSDCYYRFWLYIPSFGTLNGNLVINAGNRFRMRATNSAGNAYADFEMLFMGGDSQFESQPIRLGVDRWNHITLCKATGVGPFGEGVQKFSGTRAAFILNGTGSAADLKQRWDGTYASVGSNYVTVQNPTGAQFADTTTVGGASMSVADFAAFNTCPFNLYDLSQNNFVPPNWNDYC